MHDSRLPDLIERLYDAALAPDTLDDALERISRHFGGHGMSILDLSSPMPLVAVTPSLAPHVAPYLGGWHEKDAFVDWGRRQRIGPGVYVDHDHLDPSFRSRNDFYQDFLRPIGTDGILSAQTRSQTGRQMVFSVQRRIGAGPVSGSARRQYGVMARHLSRAATIAERLDAATALAGSLAGRLDRFDCAVAAVDAAGRIHMYNQRFDALASDAIRVSGGVVTLTAPSAQRQFVQMIADVFASPPRPTRPAMLAVRQTDTLLPLLLRVLPVSASAGERAFGSLRGRAALLMVLDPAHEAYPATPDTLTALGLTPAQARVALLVGSGLTPRDAADRLGITEATVRTTIKHLYARLGLTRQSDLALLVVRATAFGAD